MTSAPITDDRTLAALLGDLLPPADGMPTIDAPQLADFAHRQGRALPLTVLLQILGEECPGTPFADLDAITRATLLTRIRHQHLKAFADFFLLAIQCYCLDSAVRQAFGDTPAAPFPAGREVPDGSLELLEAVYERGLIFRDIPSPEARGARLPIEDSPSCS